MPQDSVGSDEPCIACDPSGGTIICFSHLRWDFVFQRPQHLMVRFARSMRVLFWEEPVGTDQPSASLQLREAAPGVTVVTPMVPHQLSGEARNAALKDLLDGLLGFAPAHLVRWYYTPMMLPFSAHLKAKCTVYDCMDELANFRFAPPELMSLEQELFAASDLVFTGGYSLYEAKRAQHPSVYPFPSSVDVAHFAAARAGKADPGIGALPRPCPGF